MSQNGNALQRTIKKAWSLLAFVREHGGKLQVGEFTNKDDGEKFKSCIVSDGTPDSRCFVAFSSKLGELTPQQIVAQKDNLRVVQFEESGNYCLCEPGDSGWVDVDLF